MNIAFVTDFYPNTSTGGASNYAFNLTKALSKYVNVSVFIPNVNTKQLGHIETDAVHYPIDTINMPILRSFSFMYNLSRKIHNSNFDILHSHGGTGAFIKTVKPLSFVETFHHWPRGLIPTVHGIPMRICLKKADRIIAVSEKSKEEVPLNFLQKNNIYVVENGIDDVYFKPLRKNVIDQLRQELHINDGKIILHVNTELSPRKNLPLMLDTIRYLKANNIDVTLLIIAPRSGEMNVTYQAKDRGILENIKYIHAGIPQQKMPYYYFIADFLAVPSLQEGFSFPLLETIATNKPFVSLNIGIAPKLSEHGFGSVVNSEIEFKEKCLDMALHPLVLSDGRRFVRDNYSWDRCARQTLEIYKMMAE